MPERSSPGPSWEALKETATTDSSADERGGWEEWEEDEIVEDNESIDIPPVSQPQTSLKRKETVNEHLVTVSKRPRHELERRQDEGPSGSPGKISGSSFSGWKMPRELTNPTASSSKIGQNSATNVNKSTFSASRVASSLMLPPQSPVKATNNDQSPKRALQLAGRPKSIPKFKSSSGSQLLSQPSQGSGSKRKEFPSTLSANLFNRPSSSQPVASSSKRSVSANDVISKSQDKPSKSISFTSNEVIDLCGDDSPPPASKPKQKKRMSLPSSSKDVIDLSDEDDAPPAPKKFTVRKSMGGKAPQKRSPKPPPQKLPDGVSEVIEISSDDGDPPPSKPPSKNAEKSVAKPANPPRPKPVPLAKNPKRASASKSAGESDSMKVDQTVPATSQSSAPTAAPIPRKVSMREADTKLVNPSRPKPVPLAKNKTKLSASRSASESDSMKVDLTFPTKPQPSASTTAPMPREVSMRESRMQVDDPPIAGSSTSISSFIPRKESITGLTENMQLNDPPIAVPPNPIRAPIWREDVVVQPSAEARPSSFQSVQVNNDTIKLMTGTSSKPESKKANTAESHPSNSISRPVPRAPVPTPNVASSSIVVKKSKPLSTSSESTAASRFPTKLKPKPDTVQPQPAPIPPIPRGPATTSSVVSSSISVNKSKPPSTLSESTTASPFLSKPKSKSNTAQPQPANSDTVPPIPRALVSTPNVASSSASVNISKPLSTSSESTTMSRFSRPQMAVKSTGGMKRRPVLPASSSSSSPGSTSGSESDDEQEEDEEDVQEVEEEVEDADEEKARPKSTAMTTQDKGKEKRNEQSAASSSRHPPRPVFNEDRQVDRRRLDEALGLEGTPSAPRTPEPIVRVKEQPISPELFPKKKGETSHKSSFSSSIDYKNRGDTLESAINLISDDEDAPMGATLPALKSPSKKPASASLTWKGKGRALPEPSPTPPPHSEPDDRLAKPSDSEPSLPPASPSPDKTPLSAQPGFAKMISGMTFTEDGRKSAPLVLSQGAMSRPFDPVDRLAGPLSAGPKMSSPAKSHLRSISLGSQTQASFDAKTVHDTTLHSNALPTSGFRGISGSPAGTTAITHAPTSTSPPQIAQANSPPPTPARLHSAMGESEALDSIPNVPSRPDSDIEMEDWDTDDDAVQEAEEVQALIEQTEDDIYDSTAEEKRAESAFLNFEDSTDAGPSNTSASRDGRYSRRSSRSSASGAERMPSDDDDVLQESRFPSRNTTPEDGPVSAVPHGKTLGGFPAITWKEYRQNLSNFTPKCRYAKDLPHALQDHINSMSERTRKLPEIRTVFEAMIQENTIEDEPNAPKIELLNDIDDEPTPPWEFYYTNEMWHATDVPPPDIKNLTSCNCKGACNPKSKTCACLRRQREALTNPNAEFMYDKNGRLRSDAEGFPINECNDLCGCGDECRNRVVQHGRKVQIFIQKTEHKGWGVFAGSKKIPKGSFIGIYSGELLTDAEANRRGLNYNKFGRTYLFDLDFHHLKSAEDKTWSSKFTVDAYHAGNFTRFLNHSCDPNCTLQPLYINEGNLEKPLLVIFSARDIEAHEEICFHYSGDPPDDDEQDERGSSPTQADKIYARCMCGASNCTGSMFKRPSK